MSKQLIRNTVDFVREQLVDAEAGHDWWHIQRVWNNTRMLLDFETGADRVVCELAALLHDIADSKFHGGDETVGPRIAGEFLRRQGAAEAIIVHIQKIIENISFKTTLNRHTPPDGLEYAGVAPFRSRELEIVQDADRLDALGAIGIARAFHYGGYKNRLLYHPDIRPLTDQDRATYKNSEAPTINHFYEKLLLLRDRMNTATGRKIASERHAYMEGFLKQFFEEWGEGAQPLMTPTVRMHTK